MNGSKDDAVMIIDSDSEEEEEMSVEEKEQPTYEFEEDEAEVDPSRPYEDILREVDIWLGSSVLDMAVPPQALEQPMRSLSPDSFPSILKDMIVIAAVCADFSTRIVALPLEPPHPDQTNPSAWKVQTLSINGTFSRQEMPGGVSITFTRRGSGDGEASGEGQWDLLVATHSAEASGLLLVHRMPVVKRTSNDATTYALSQDDVEPIRRCYLSSPAKSIAFNPCLHPSPHHSALLVSFPSGCVKIYSCFSVRRPKRASDPRSAAEVEGNNELGGKWLITLYPGFGRSASGTVCRKTVVDAQWVLGGQAVIVLLSDGTWGVWDVEGAGPGSAKGPIEGQRSIQGVSGGSLTAFSVSGRILNPLPGNNHRDTKFTPMTPSTKRIRENSLLKGAASSSSLGGSTLNNSQSSLRGEISVFQANSPREAIPDECILFRHGNEGAIIPSLLSLWRNALTSTGTLDASNRCRVSILQGVDLLGEQLKGIGHLPPAARHARTGRAFDILVTGEHRILILSSKLAVSDSTAYDVPGEPLPPHESVAANTDQLQLRRGELDVQGIDRVLRGMANVNRLQSPVKRPYLFS